MASEIVIEIDAQGNVQVEGVGFVGPECGALTKDLETALGEVTKKQLKPAFHQTQAVRRKQGA